MVGEGGLLATQNVVVMFTIFSKPHLPKGALVGMYTTKVVSLIERPLPPLIELGEKASPKYYLD